MDLGLQGKRALVLGSSRGLGLAIARHWLPKALRSRYAAAVVKYSSMLSGS